MRSGEVCSAGSAEHRRQFLLAESAELPSRFCWPRNISRRIARMMSGMVLANALSKDVNGRLHRTANPESSTCRTFIAFPCVPSWP